MQDERQPLGGRQSDENDEERQAHAIREHGIILRARFAAHQEIWYGQFKGILSLYAP